MRKKRNKGIAPQKRIKGTSSHVVVTLDLPAKQAVKLEKQSRQQKPVIPFNRYLGQQVTAALNRFETDVDVSLVDQANQLMEYKDRLSAMQKEIHTTFEGKIRGVSAALALELVAVKKLIDDIHRQLAALCQQNPTALTQLHEDATLAADACLGPSMSVNTTTHEARALAVLLVALNAVGDPNFR